MLKFNWICWAIFLSVSERVSNSDLKYEKYYTAYTAAHQTGFSFFNLFEQCLEAVMPNQQFEIDDLKSFVNHPSKTTVGYAPKYTSNRKFFANLITSTAFKEMLAKDQEELKRILVRKMKYCDEVVMDQKLLKDFYEREIDH